MISLWRVQGIEWHGSDGRVGNAEQRNIAAGVFEIGGSGVGSGGAGAERFTRGASRCTKVGEAAEYYLREMKENTKKNNIEFMVILLPYSYQMARDEEFILLPQKKMISLLDKLQIEYIDLYHALKTKKNPGRYYLGDDITHFNPEGHAVIQNALYNKIKEKLFIDPEDAG